MTNPTNNPAKRGQVASESESFTDRLSGCHFKVAAVHTRFDAVEWFVWDMTDRDDVTGGPAVVGQFDTKADADDCAMDCAQGCNEVAGEVGMSFIGGGGNPADAGVEIFNFFASRRN